MPAPISGFTTSAYRADLDGRENPFGLHDSEWVAVSTQLEHARVLPEPERSTILDATIEMAGRAIGATAVAGLRSGDWNGIAPGPYDAIVALADQAHDAHAFRLAAHMLDALLTAVPLLEDLHKGRILIRLARILHKLGHVEQAADHYTLVLKLARQSGAPELEARGWLGRAILAQMRGNYPEVARFGKRAARIADREGLRSVSRNAHTSLMIAAGITGRLADALAHGWRAYDVSRGQATHEAEVLINLAQALFDAGYVKEARAGFASVVATSVPAKLMLPALGGFAIVSAVLGDGPAVAWAAREVERIKDAGATHFNLASALLECAMAFATLRQGAPAAQYARTALEIARAHGFHEIVYKAESLDCSVPPAAPHRAKLGARAVGVARDVARLEPEYLPKHVVLAAHAP